MSWLVADDRLEQGILIANKLTKNKFGTLINNVCQRVQQQKIKSLFGEDEKTMLQTSLDLQAKQVENLIYAITTVIFKASSANIDEIKLKDTLVKFNFDEVKATMFSEYWSLERKSIISKLEEKSSIWPNMTDVNWSLDVETSSSIRAKEARVSVKLQLDLEDEEKSKLKVEMDRQCLTELYQTIEQIQIELDKLKNK